LTADSDLLSRLCASARAAQYLGEGRDELVGRREQQFSGLLWKIVTIFFDEACCVVLNWPGVMLNPKA